MSLITGTVEDAIRDVLDSDDDAAREYLRASFLASAVDSLWRARTDAGLTQTEVAHLLGTKQSAIARLEADTGGTLSLHRYIDYCLAVGKFPLDIELVPFEDLRAYARARPDASRTAEGFRSWQQSQAASRPQSAMLAEPEAPELVPGQLEQGVTVAGQQSQMSIPSHRNRQTSTAAPALLNQLAA